jgi:hypothetical protein
MKLSEFKANIERNRVALPTPKQSDMERALRALLTQNENHLLTIELAKSPSARDVHIAMLVANSLVRKAGR